MAPMSTVELIVGIAIILLTLWDAFETVVLPRTVRRRFRLSSIVVRTSWVPLQLSTLLPVKGNARESVLSIYGPLVLVFIFMAWVLALIVAFALMYHSFGADAVQGEKHLKSFSEALYFSGTTFFTLGLGDVTPTKGVAEGLTVFEAGTGFALLALVIGYLPIFYTAFSRREVSISLLDSRAGSPPTATEFIRRNRGHIYNELLPEWERWVAELLESHLSYPILVFFRSQHERQSWLAALTMICDTSALIMVGVEGIPMNQAQFTFAMVRHTLVDLCQVFFLEPLPPSPPRLNHEILEEMRSRLAHLGLKFVDEDTAEARLEQIRAGYEPLANALAKRLLIDLPPWVPGPVIEDNWQSSPWDMFPGF